MLAHLKVLPALARQLGIFLLCSFLPAQGAGQSGILFAPTLAELDSVKGKVIYKEMVQEEVEPEAIQVQNAVGTFLVTSKNSYIAKGAGQHFVLEEDQTTFLIGKDGTRFYAKGRRIVMHKGKAIAFVGKYQSLDFITDFGEVEVPKRSSAIIEFTDDGVLRVDNLEGKPLIITFRINYRPFTYSAARGEEFCVASDACYDKSKLVPNDGVEREKSPYFFDIDGTCMCKNRFDEKMMLEQEALLLCDPDANEETAKRIATLKKRAKHLKRFEGAEPEAYYGKQLAYQYQPRRRQQERI